MLIWSLADELFIKREEKAAWFSKVFNQQYRSKTSKEKPQQDRGCRAKQKTFFFKVAAANVQ